MALDKLVDSAQLDSDLTSVANAIRAKSGGSAQLAFPNGFVSAVQNIPTGIVPAGTKQISITENGTTTEDVAGYANAEIIVNVSGGGGSVETGSFIATTKESLTIPVTSLHSYVSFWHEDFDLQKDLTGNPYGAYKVFARTAVSLENSEVPGNSVQIFGWMTNYTGTAWNGFAAIPSGYYNKVVFSESSIQFSGMRVNGGNYQMVDGATYYWRAW